MANTLQQLFLGAAGLPSGAPGLPRTGAPGVPGVPGVPGGPTVPGGVPRVTGAAPLQLTLGGGTPGGAPIGGLRPSLGRRTNSLIVAGSRDDLELIRTLISRLEDSDIQGRRNEVYRLKNAVAADVAAALNDFLSRALTVYRTAGQLTGFQEIERDVVIAAEAVTNTLLISATPRYFDDIMRLIRELYARPPEVVIQALIAEVDLTGTEEFGVEIGLQSPVLFQRGVIPASGFIGPNGSVNFTNPGLVPQGVTVNSSINPAALPSFNFN